MATPLNTSVRVEDWEGRKRRLSVGDVLNESSRHLAAGKHQNALLLLEQAVRQVPAMAALRYNLGIAQDLSGQAQEALESLRKAVEAEPANPHFRLGLAQLVRNTNRLEAIPHFQAAIDLGSTQPQAFWMLAGILLEQNKPDEALTVCVQGLQACPDNFELLAVQAIACLQLGLYQEAVTSCFRQREQRPNELTACTHLGMGLRALGRLGESEEILRHACLLDPMNASAHFQLSLTLLLAGQYKEGFQEYEWRWQLDGRKKDQRAYSQPLWDGSELTGKRILLWPEQGVGDLIQFSRYIPFVEKKGGRVIVEVPFSMVRLMRGVRGNVEITDPGSGVAFDTHCRLMSLPRTCGQEDPRSIPPPLSWSIPDELWRQWNNRLGPKQHKRVGLVWAGNSAHSEDRQRSIQLELFRPLFAVPNVTFFSLQVGTPSKQIEQVDFGTQLQNLAPLCLDFAETAAALTHMDLVISVDTSVAHLAGSLGVSTWVLLSFAADWRWLLGRQDTVWYPSLRLFRQTQPGDWQTVIAAVAGELARG